MAIAVTGSDQMGSLETSSRCPGRSSSPPSLSGGGETGEFTTTISGDMFVMAPAVDPDESQPEAAE